MPELTSCPPVKMSVSWIVSAMATTTAITPNHTRAAVVRAELRAVAATSFDIRRPPLDADGAVGVMLGDTTSARLPRSADSRGYDRRAGSGGNDDVVTR
ncbi:hypothetical protein GCM10009758_21350 [Microbacterium hatanonis]